MDVAILGILFTEIVQLAVFGKNNLLKLLDPPDLNVHSWQELVQVQEATLEPSILYLTLQGC